MNDKYTHAGHSPVCFTQEDACQKAEIEALRAQVKTLTAENEAMRKVVDLVRRQHAGHKERWLKAVRGRSEAQFDCPSCRLLAALPHPEGEKK